MGEVSLEEFLRPVSAALGHASVPTELRAPDSRKGLGLEAFGRLSRSQLADRFEEQAAGLGVRVARATARTAGTAVATMARGLGAKRAVFANDPRVEKFGLLSALALAGVMARRWDASDPRGSVAACEQADLGVTFPLAGIAYSGTVAEACDERCGRAVSLLPAVHVAVLSVSALVPRSHTLLAALDQRRREAGPGALPSSVVLVSGPSNTADIELVRVVGVHGPMRMGVVLVEDA